jgi:hypothetical protein
MVLAPDGAISRYGFTVASGGILMLLFIAGLLWTIISLLVFYGLDYYIVCNSALKTSNFEFLFKNLDYESLQISTSHSL